MTATQAPATATPLTIWAVSDGKIGNANQVLGLAETIAERRPADIVVKTLVFQGPADRLPWQLNRFPRAGLASASGIAPPWPNLWLAVGRASVPGSMAVRRWSRGRTFVVQLQDPRAPATAFDLMIPPRHDRARGDNVFPITGSPNRVTAARLAAELPRFASLLAPLPHPRIAVVIGGKSKSHDLTRARAEAMADEIARAIKANGGSLLLTFSRRTPDPARALMTERLRGLPGVIWDGTGDNPYFAFLAAAEFILVTEDSTNLATEAAATGRPLYVLGMAGGSAKFARFHQDLYDRGVARPFEGRLETWTYPPLLETARAADEVLRRYDERRGR